MIIPPTLSSAQLHNSFQYAQDLVSNLSDKAILELMGGYENDIDKMLDSILVETNNIINLHHKEIKSSNIQYLPNLEMSMHNELKILSYNYFKTTCLPEFGQNWRNLEWGNMVQLFNHLAILAARSSGKSFEFSYALPLWKMYRYRRPIMGRDTIDNRMSKEGVIMSNALKLGRKLLSKINEEIMINDILRERFVGEGKMEAKLGADRILTRNGALIELRSFDNSIRGLHPGWIGVDDFLDKSAIYSQEQRDKFKEVFTAEILPALEPNGQIVTVGTPFHPMDLYDLIRKDPRFYLFEYPSIFPDGRLLATDRYDLDKLMAEKQTLGSAVFAREYLITPISDTSSIFPWEFLKKSFIGMENTSFADNINSFPIKFKRVITACDLAITANVGGDYCAFITLGLDQDDNIYIINVWHKQGASYNEQINQICSIDQRYKPNKIVVENNGFQKVIADLAKDRGLKNIAEFHQGTLKKDLREGFPALSATFERGGIRIPYRDGKTREVAEKVCAELNSITYHEDTGKLEAASGHDDLAHSLYIGFHELKFNKRQVRISLV